MEKGSEFTWETGPVRGASGDGDGWQHGARVQHCSRRYQSALG